MDNEISDKSAIDENQKAAISIIGGIDPLNRIATYSYPQTPEQLMNRAMGYVGICADKQASFICSQPLRLYHRVKTQSQNTKSKAKIVDRKKLDWMRDRKNLGKSSIYAEQASQVEEITDAPVLQLLHKPNETMLGTDFMYALAWHRSITGNSYFYIEYANSRVVALHVLYPQYVSPIVKDGIHVGYEYGTNQKEFFDKDEISHQKYRPSRYNTIYGESPLHSCLIAADILNAQNVRELCFQENDCRPSFAIKVPAEASNQQMVDTENRFNSKFRGHKNAGKFAVVRDSEITQLGFSPKDLEGINLRKEMKQEIFAAYGISESEFSTNDANLASSVTGNIQFFRNIKPLLIKNAEELTNILIPIFYPNAEDGEYFFAYDEVIPQVEKPTLTYAEKLNLGIMSINEMRAELSLPPVEGGDNLRINGQTLSNLDNPQPSGLLPQLGLQATIEQPKTIHDIPDLLAKENKIETKQEDSTKQEESYEPTDGMVEEALRGLKWREEYNRGGTEVGVARARDISNKRNLTENTVRRMVSYFARHEVDKQGQGFNQGEDGYPSAGRIAWALWGGDAGQTWANAIVDRLDAEEKSYNPHCDCDKCDCDKENDAVDCDCEKKPIEIPCAEKRQEHRRHVWKNKIHMDTKTETEYAKEEIKEATKELENIYIMLSQELKFVNEGDKLKIEMGDFEKRLNEKLLKALKNTFLRGYEDGVYKLNTQKAALTTEAKASMPSLDINPDNAARSFQNYIVRLARFLTETQQSELNDAITTAISQGQSLNTLTNNIKEVINETATWKAERIARTETARGYIAGQKQSWTDADVQKMVPILAPNSCSICKERFNAQKDGVSIDTPSEELPPYHPQCRCDCSPVIE